MKKWNLIPALIVLCVISFACGKKESAASIAKKWCELTAKKTKATTDAEREAASKELNEYENKIEAKYKDNEAFIKEVEQEAEKCEDEAEGRK